jgi:hypothetical protein
MDWDRNSVTAITLEDTAQVSEQGRPKNTGKPGIKAKRKG